MGRRISMMWSAAGYSVMILEKSTDNYDNALDYIQQNKPTQAAMMGTKPTEVKLTASLEEAASNAWMIIETMQEILVLKIMLLGELHMIAPPDCILATNASSLRSSQMLAKTKNNYRILTGQTYMPPEQAFFEVMSCGYTDPDIFPFLTEKAATAGFRPVHAKKESTGLVANRIWAAIKHDCLLVMADEISDAKTIDEMFKSWFKAY
jgi:3-hydroxyacyl-CoA dehydrogenase